MQPSRRGRLRTRTGIPPANNLQIQIKKRGCLTSPLGNLSLFIQSLRLFTAFLFPASEVVGVAVAEDEDLSVAEEFLYLGKRRFRGSSYHPHLRPYTHHPRHHLPSPHRHPPPHTNHYTNRTIHPSLLQILHHNTYNNYNICNIIF